MFKRSLIILLIPLALMHISESSLAGSLAKPSSSSPPVSIFGYFGRGNYKMDDINNIIDNENSWLGGEYLEHLDHGTEAGGRLIVHLNSHLEFGLSVTALDVETGTNNEIGISDFDVSAHTYELIFIAMRHPENRPNIGGGASLGWLYADGELKGHSSFGEYFQGSFSGNTPLLSGFGVAELKAVKGAWLRLETGFRWAAVEEVKWSNGNEFVDVEGENISLSYTGLFVRLGIRLSGDFLN